MREEWAGRRQRLEEEREAFLFSQLEPDEHIVARSGTHPIVTDRRILDVRSVWDEKRGSAWTCDSLGFEQITSWSKGRAHDDRPLLQLEHRPIEWIEQLPAHRFLWFQWGNTYGPVLRTTTNLAFGRKTDPVLLAITEALDHRAIPPGDPFVVRPPGTREERLSRHVVLMTSAVLFGGATWAHQPTESDPI